MGQGPASTPPGGYGPAFAPAAVPVPMFPTGSPISGPPISGPPISAAPMSGSPGSGDGRRRTTLVAVAAAAVAVAVVGIGTAIAMRPGTSEAGTHDGPDLGLAEQRQNPGGNPAGRGPGAISLPALPPNSKSARPRPSATSTAPAGTGPSTSVSADPTEPTATATTTAATNPYTAKQACGSAFSVIDQAALKNTAGTVLGRVYLLYNSSTGKNCTVTLKTTDVGTATAATAYLEVEGSTRVTDSGNFTYYAGPVKAAANGVCVKWGGSIQGAAYDSPFEHCD